MLNNFTGKIFFYCCPLGPPEDSAYQHLTVCLAEGFKSLGVDFFSDRNYWRIYPEKEEYLLSHDPGVTPDDCSIVIIDHNWFSHGRPIPENLFHPNRKYITVYLDLAAASKQSRYPEFRQFDFIFRPHYNSRCQSPANVYPWAFGLSNRILQATSVIHNFQDREKSLLVNFRIHNHPLRNFIAEKFLPRIKTILPIDNSVDNDDHPLMEPYDYLQWVQSGKRHYPSYYKRLTNSVGCACFGGLLVKPWPRDSVAYDLKPRKYWQRALNSILNTLDPRPPRLMNWESYRFWESLAAGCVPFHVDFEKYSALLPVMPENWRHYIGIDLDNVQAAVDRILDDPGVLKRIATEGRLWAIEHYSPVPTALRFLETINQNN